MREGENDDSSEAAGKPVHDLLMSSRGNRTDLGFKDQARS